MERSFCEQSGAGIEEGKTGGRDDLGGDGRRGRGSAAANIAEHV